MIAGCKRVDNMGYFQVTVFLLISNAFVALADSQLSNIINRLPRNLLPYHYDLSIRPDISGSPPFPFSGTVTIHLECLESTDVLILNAFKLSINLKTVKITASPNNSISVPDPEFSFFIEIFPKDELHFKVKNSFVKQAKYIFQASFSGVMRKPGEDGLYWDSYTGLDNSKKYIVATQLESIDARKMFPCFDEVDMKATFSISVQRLSKNHVALSNMPKIKTTSLPNGWVEDYFDKTPVMSTYLVCVIVGEFKQVVAPTPPGTSIKISLYATEVQVKNLEYMKNFAVTKLQKWYDDNTGYPFREPKMDHVALPSKSGAMENWGIITYSEEMLCVNNETTSIVGKFNGVTIMSHELAHMWYGNLVTCKWWDDLWIQEGFATHYNYNPTEVFGWEWMQTQQSDMRRGVQYFMAKDQKNTTEKVRKHIGSPQESESSFTGSAYNKGGAIIRQLQGILTRPVLNKALTKYLHKNAYKNSVTAHLAEALNEQARLEGITYPNNAPLDFNVILDPWLNQIGYPLVSAERISNTLVRVSQRHYLHPVNQTISVPSKFNYRWEIPITKVTKSSKPSDWDRIATDWIHLNQTSKLLVIKDAPENWFIINPRQHFFYRVLYDRTNRFSLAKQLLSQHEVIPPETRSQLIDDNFDLARNVYFPVTDALEFSDYLSSELSYNPWSSALKHFHFISPLFEFEDFYPEYQAYFRKRLDKVLDRTGYDFPPNETVLQTYLRKDAIASACPLGSKTCLPHVRKLYLNYIKTPNINSVNANVLPTVLCQGVFDGGVKDWLLMYEQYKNRRSSQVKDERHAYIFSLVCTDDKDLLDRVFDDIVNGKTFIPKDVNQATQYLASTKHGANRLWKYLDENWQNPAPGVGKLATITTITNKWFTPSQLTSLKNFIAKRSKLTPAENESLTQNVLQVELNLKFHELNVSPTKEWFAQRSSNEDESPEDSSDKLVPNLAPSAQFHWTLLQDLYNRESGLNKRFE